MSASTLAKINVYPVKSVAGVSMSTAWVEKQGLMFDRRFMLAKADGAMVTARKYPHMVQVKSVLCSDGLLFTAPNRAALRIRYSEFKMQPTPVTVWSDTFSAFTTSDEADDWFSDVVGCRVELVFTGEQSQRVRETLGHNVSFADGYPLLIISEGSLAELNKRSSDTHTMDQFRTNLVASDLEPFVEDSWKRIRIGEVEFEAVKPCERCILTTVDTQTGQLRDNKEPLKTLSDFRANEFGGVFLGQNLVAKNEGMIRAGDPIEVLEYKEKEFYADNSPQLHQLTCVEREDIARNFTTFWFESEQLIEYKAGQHLPIQITLDGEQVARRYTLSSSPSRPNKLAISVKKIAGGRISHWLSEHLQVGDVLSCQSPDGCFHLEENHFNPTLLLSAGSGVTPMLSMLRYLADNKQLDDVVFYHQCSTEADIPYRSELEQLAREHGGLKVLISLSKAPLDWFGLKGRLSPMHLKQVPDIAKREVYVCGPEGFMQQAKSMLLQVGMNEDQYHQEAFTAMRVEHTVEQTVTVKVNSHQFVGDNQRTMLEQAEEAGVNIPNSCRAGLCGACRVKVVSGKVTHAQVPALDHIDVAGGEALACCAVPSSDIEVKY
ncbi:ferredoxin/oxidoreductase [Vibrio sp. N418]|uniref:hybrid-cluster NAD(P)-dependent oxidoreductase n=1 Tax=Vibrio sp. (strain N418) TaxID=701176 RepID=UPI00021BFA45|nr:hybrid-cluster NAD(P)-dependent oxidoreductase [Vibrio sp. N418]EGU36069.1 ferredoxin/oxidoreductase [Vibrio sp. N418]